MNLQVNLLKKSEQRFQGVVSLKVMAFGAAGILAAVTLLTVSLSAAARMRLNAQAERVRMEWKEVDAPSVRARANQTALDANRKVLAIAEGRAESGVIPMYRVLLAVQENIPERMAIGVLRAGEEQGADKKIEKVLSFSGRARGELTAVEARRNLNRNATLQQFCGELRLISSQRAEGDNWIFALEGRRAAEGSP